MLLIVLLLSCLTLWLAYKRFAQRFNYWESRGVPYLKGSFPLGTSPNIIFSSEYQGYAIKKIYDKLSPYPFGGFYIFNTPQLLLRDPGIIKNVLIKDFAYFRNRSKINNNSQRFINKNLFHLEGAKWRALRFKLKPLFSTMKLKSMFNIFEQSSNKLREKLKNRLATSAVLDVKSVYLDFTSDQIVSCVFGIDADEEACEQFRRVIHAVLPRQKTFSRTLMSVVALICPSLRFLLPSPLPKKMETFLLENVRKTIEQRENSGIVRNDFLNLLINLMKKGKLYLNEETKTFSGDDDQEQDVEVDLPLIAAQCFVFFVAGLDGPSTMSTYVLYELAIHQAFQDRLRTEITKVLADHDNRITYDALKDMKYLDQVVKETLRKYVSLPIITRICVKDYPVPGTRTVIEKGTRILIPSYALHFDENLFPHPHRFDPERFSAENVNLITPCSLLSFGEGPRNCIGMRFGLFLIKLGIVTVLSEYKVQKTSETPETLEMGPAPTSGVPKVPVRLAFKKVN